MSITFKLLKQGNPEILEMYRSAYELWGQILSEYDGNSSELAEVISRKQSAFEWLVRDDKKYHRREGQEIMVFSGLTYYLENDDDNSFAMASSVAEAFEFSYCSLEVKALAKRAAKLFYLG